MAVALGRGAFGGHTCGDACRGVLSPPLGMMTCSDCDGAGCAACKRSGSVLLVECPRRLAARTAHLLRPWAMLKRHNALPDGGGWLRQTWFFTDLIAFIDCEVAEQEAELARQ